jgi:hypothetical protein
MFARDILNERRGYFMIASILFRILAAVSFATVTLLVVRRIDKKSDVPLPRGYQIALFMALTAVFFAPLYFSMKAKPEPDPEVLSASIANLPEKGTAGAGHVPESKREIRIVTIDGQPVAAAASARPGYEVRIEGDVTPGEDLVYLVVKPHNDPHWYVQPNCVEIGSTSDNRSKWAGQAYLGTRGEGIGVTFDIFAVAMRGTYDGNDMLDAEPLGLRSSKVTLTRGD